MGTIDSRRRRKEQKERQQRKRSERLAERRTAQIAAAVESLTSQVSGLVADGSAKVAVGMVPGQEDLIVAMWDDTEPRVLARRLANHDDWIASALLRRDITPDEWLPFLMEFLRTSASAGPGQAAISMIQWRPGEGPPIASASTPALPAGLPGGVGMGH